MNHGVKNVQYFDCRKIACVFNYSPSSFRIVSTSLNCSIEQLTSQHFLSVLHLVILRQFILRATRRQWMPILTLQSTVAAVHTTCFHIRNSLFWSQAAFMGSV